MTETFQLQTPVFDGDTGELVGYWLGFKFVREEPRRVEPTRPLVPDTGGCA